MILRYDQSHRQGFILVAVLWILGSLGVLVSAYAVYVIETMPGLLVYENRVRTEGLVSAALELTAHKYLTSSGPLRPRRGHFKFRLDQADVAVEFGSETSRIDLNAASKELLAGLFRALSVRSEEAQRYSEAIVAWRTPAQPGRRVEPSIGLPSAPRQGPLPLVSELSLVDGLPPAIVERIIPFVTVYSGRPQVNILDAAPQVVAALPGMNTERVHAVIAQRQITPGNMEALVPFLGAAQQFVTSEGGRALRVTVRIGFSNGHRAEAEAVILVFEEGDEPYSVLSWDDHSSRPDRNQIGMFLR